MINLVSNPNPYKGNMGKGAKKRTMKIIGKIYLSIYRFVSHFNRFRGEAAK